MKPDKQNLPPSTSTPSLLPGLSLRVNFSWTFAGNMIYAASQWGMLVVLAKLGSPEMVGQFGLGLAVTAPVIMLSNLALRTVQATDARQEYVFGDYLGLRLITATLALLVIAGIVFLSGYRQESALIILVVGLAKVFEAISNVFYGFIQQHERMDHIAISRMIKGPLSLVALALGVYLTGSVLWGAVGLVVVWAGLLLGYDMRSTLTIVRSHPQQYTDTTLRPRWHLPTLARLSWLALPLGLVLMLISLNTNIPRYFIEHELGEYDLGIFAALAYLIVAGNMIIDALGQAAIPRLAKYYAAGKRSAFIKLLIKLTGFGAAIGAAAITAAALAGELLLTLLYDAEYARQDLLVWLMVAAAISYVASFLSRGVTAARYFRVQLPLFLCVTGSTVLLSFWLIPAMGLQGAAFALITSACIQMIGYIAILAHALHNLVPGEETES